MINELRQKAAELGIKVDGRWKEDRLLQVIADASDVQVGQAEAAHIPDVEVAYDPDDGIPTSAQIKDMNAYALRIWLGQSVDLPRHERINRVKSALVDQGYGISLEHLSLPNA